MSTITDISARMSHAVEGPAFASADENTVEFRPQALYIIDDSGIIADILTPDDSRYFALRGEAARLGRLTSLAEGQYLLPGFSDLHVHAPQWVQDGTALDEPLERWLGKYTFPTESRFADKSFADRAHAHLVDALLARGTTSVLYFDTIHRESAVGLAKICADKGQRAFVGKVVMDDPQASPDYYRENTDEALADTEAFVNDVDGVRCAQGVHPVVTPRFVPSCTDRALEGLGEIAAKYHAYVQSHCSESDWEHGEAMRRYGRSDTEALDTFGLLTDRTVMHHCVFLSESDADLFARRGAAVAHCPLSNAYFGDAVAPIRRYRSQGVTVGLGTDISGGYDPSIYSMIRMAAISSRALMHGVNPAMPAASRGVPGSMITLDQAFWLATVGGASALHVNAGALRPGEVWDAQLIDVHAPGNDLPVFDADEDPRDVFQKIINLSTPANIHAVWVQGMLVHGSVA